MGAISKDVSFYQIKDLFPLVDFEHDLEICKKLVIFNLKNIDNVPCKKEDIKDAIFERLKNPYSYLKNLTKETIEWINENFSDKELAEIFVSNPCGCMRLDYTSGGYDYHSNSVYKKQTFITNCFIKPDVITSDVLQRAFEVVKKINNSYSQSPSKFLSQLKYYSAFNDTDLFGRLSRETVLSIPTIGYRANEAIEAYFAPVKKDMDGNDTEGWVINDKEFLLKWIENCSTNAAISKASIGLRYDEDVIRAAIDSDKRAQSQLKNTDFLLNKKAIKMDFNTVIYLVAHTFDENSSNSSKLRKIVELSDSLTKEEISEVCKYAFSIDKSCIEGIPKEMLTNLFESTFVNKKEGIRSSSDWKDRFESSFDKNSFTFGKGRAFEKEEQDGSYDEEKDLE